MLEPIRVLISDDHPFIREGIRATLNMTRDIVPVGEAIDGYETQRLCQELRPDVVLLDLSMPGPSAFVTVTQLRTISPQTRVLVLSAYDDDAHIRGMLSAGVAGYVLKDEAPDVVTQAIRIAMQGGSWFSQPILDKLAQRESEAPLELTGPPLTARELENLRLVVANKTNQEIAITLTISEKTVEKHLKNVFRKLGVTTRLEAALRARDLGLG